MLLMVQHIGAVALMNKVFLLEERAVAIPQKIRPKVADIIRQLLSDREGSILAAVRALKLIADIHAIAEPIKRPPLSKEEMEKIFEEGRAQGLEDAERKQIEAINSTEDDPDWEEAVHLLQRFKNHFGEQHRDFIDHMAEMVDDGRRHTDSQDPHPYRRGNQDPQSGGSGFRR